MHERDGNRDRLRGVQHMNVLVTRSEIASVANRSNISGSIDRLSRCNVCAILHQSKSISLNGFLETHGCRKQEPK